MVHSLGEFGPVLAGVLALVRLREIDLEAQEAELHALAELHEWGLVATTTLEVGTTRSKFPGCFPGRIFGLPNSDLNGGTRGHLPSGIVLRNCNWLDFHNRTDPREFRGSKHQALPDSDTLVNFKVAVAGISSIGRILWQPVHNDIIARLQ
jgi:hypothetical protein